MRREEDLEMCLTAATPRPARNHPCERKKTHKTHGRHRHKQSAVVLARTLPTFSFVISMLMRFLSPSVQFVAFFFFPLQTISDSFSQLTQMASINFFIKIRIFKSEHFNKPPRDRQGATRISQCIVEYADSICSLFPSLLHQTARTSHSALHLV